MTRILFLCLIISLLPAFLHAHPAGNLVTAGDYLLWPYVYPVDDAQHHSSVLIWDRQSPVRPLITSEFAGSNYLLYAREDTVYYIESRDSQTENKSYFRVLKGKAGEKPVEIWPWRTDEWRVGNNGFYAVDDGEIIFSRYPNVYSIKKNAPLPCFSPRKNRSTACENYQTGTCCCCPTGYAGCWIPNSGPFAGGTDSSTRTRPVPH